LNEFAVTAQRSLFAGGGNCRSNAWRAPVVTDSVN